MIILKMTNLNLNLVTQCTDHTLILESYVTARV